MVIKLIRTLIFCMLKLLVRSRALIFWYHHPNTKTQKSQAFPPSICNSASLVSKEVINQHFNPFLRLVQEEESISLYHDVTCAFFAHMTTRMKTLDYNIVIWRYWLVLWHTYIITPVQTQQSRLWWCYQNLGCKCHVRFFCTFSTPCMSFFYVGTDQLSSYNHSTWMVWPLPITNKVIAHCFMFTHQPYVCGKAHVTSHTSFCQHTCWTCCPSNLSVTYDWLQ